MSRQILNGWKEISSHIERSVRTAQRWEAQLGLPVYRPALRDSGVVVAFTDELDRWICRTSPLVLGRQPALPAAEQEDQDLLRVLEDMSTLAWDTAELASRMRLLQEQLRTSLQLYRQRIASRPSSRWALLQGQPLGGLLNFPAATDGNGRVPTPDELAGESTKPSQLRGPYSR